MKRIILKLSPSLNRLNFLIGCNEDKNCKGTKKTFCKLIISVLLFINFTTNAQSPLQVTDSVYKDSIKNTPYPYALPIFAKKIQKRGIELPLPYGLMFNYVHQASELKLTDLSIAVGNKDYVPLDFVKFDNIQNKSDSYSIKADAWILPFLNVYGVYARSNSQSTIPMTFPINIDIKVSPDVNTYGLGGVVAYRWNEYFTVANYNFTWSNVSTIDHTLKGRIASIRVGRVFDLPRKFHNISLSVGTQHQYVDRFTEGSLPINTLFSGIDPTKLQELKSQVESTTDNWYDNLNKPQQIIVNRLINQLENWVEGKTPGDIPISYRFNKENLAPWSLQLGVQYNYGRRWWYRVESGVSSSRTQFLFSANYRFGF